MVNHQFSFWKLNVELLWLMEFFKTTEGTELNTEVTKKVQAYFAPFSCFPHWGHPGWVNPYLMRQVFKTSIFDKRFFITTECCKHLVTWFPFPFPGSTSPNIKCHSERTLFNPPEADKGFQSPQLAANRFHLIHLRVPLWRTRGPGFNSPQLCCE